MLISDENVTLGLFAGMSFRFIDFDNIIEVRLSPFSGEETVHFNGEIVSRSRSSSVTRTHPFSAAGADYIVQFAATNIFKGDTRCALQKNGEEIRCYRITRTQPREWPCFVILLLVGFVLRYVQTAYGFTYWFTVLGITLVLILSFWHQRGSWSYEIDA